MTRMIEEARCIFTRLWADAVWGNRPPSRSAPPGRATPRGPCPTPSRPPEAVPAAPWRRQKPRQISLSSWCRGVAGKVAMPGGGAADRHGRGRSRPAIPGATFFIGRRLR